MTRGQAPKTSDFVGLWDASLKRVRDRADVRSMISSPRFGRSRAPGLRRAMTLIELTMAVALSAGMAVVIGHVVTQMTRGAASVDRRSQDQTEAALAMLRMSSELEYAKNVTYLSTRKVTFRHPDVTGDNNVDTVTFEWSGVVNDPLTRTVNGNPAETIVEKCQSFNIAIASPAVRLQAGMRYDIRVDYFESTSSAVARLLWSSPSVSKQIVPTARLYPAYTPPGTAPPSTTGSGIGLIGKYYDNSDFTNLKLTRLDANIDFDWLSGSPDSSIGNNTFSVRWSGQIKPTVTDDYTFYTVSEEGIRLWVDNKLLIDNYSNHASTEDKGASRGATTMELKLEAGSPGNPVRLDAAVSLLNAPPYGGS